MRQEKLLEEIRDANLNYLLLALAMIRADRESAIYRLGVSEELAGLLETLSPAQLLKLSGTATLLCRFRYDDNLFLGLLSGHAKERPMVRTHAAIVGANRPVEAVA